MEAESRHPRKHLNIFQYFKCHIVHYSFPNETTQAWSIKFVVFKDCENKELTSKPAFALLPSYFLHCIEKHFISQSCSPDCGLII